MFGLYIHWPFCLSKCIYCDFGSKIASKERLSNPTFQNLYCECCKKQMHYFAKKIQNNQYQQSLTSIYFGGGTPSLLNPENIKQIIQEAKNLFNLSTDCEITLEANPTSFEMEKFMLFRNAGVNRISLGIQSFDDNELLWLGRKHNVQQAVDAINTIKTIFPKWNFDLIYGLPKQTLKKWIEELNFAFQLSPQHLSLYTLIVDEDTPLGKMVKDGNIEPKTEYEMADFYDATNDFILNSSSTNEGKINQYEVSNYAIRGYESRHNLCYWKSYDYIGIGAMAHGRLRYADGERYEITNIDDVKKWISNIGNDGNGLVVEKKLSQKENIEEILLMGLRTTTGIDVADTNKRFNIQINNYLHQQQIKDLVQNDFLVFNNNILRLTNKGISILDTILQKILI